MTLELGLLALLAYAIGGIPFGYLIGRLRGKNLFEHGSKNIGATNAFRVLGPAWGSLVFILDLLKGALPTAFAYRLAGLFGITSESLTSVYPGLSVLVGAMAFLGHLFPAVLLFRGGKGVATGAGVLFVLTPGPTSVALLIWLVVYLASCYVSLASLVAVTVLLGSWLLTERQPFEGSAAWVTGFLVFAWMFLMIKHRGNIARLRQGTENRFRELSLTPALLRGSYVVSLGLWFGGSIFFNYAVALPTFPWFKQIVYAGPTDRTANLRIIAEDATTAEKDALASALAGSVVGPIFPRYFALQGICAVVAVVISLAWKWRFVERIHQVRFWVIATAGVLVAVGWPLSEYVSFLRVQRFHPDPEVAAAARAAFGPWHLPSLALSFLTTILSGIGLCLAAAMPAGDDRACPSDSPPA
jgi:acyl-phosphate glycerol 3-phosphate acyltransferase